MRRKRIIGRIILLLLLIILYLSNNDASVETIKQYAILQTGFDLKSSIFIALGLGVTFGTFGIKTEEKEKNSTLNKKDMKKKN